MYRTTFAKLLALIVASNVDGSLLGPKRTGLAELERLVQQSRNRRQSPSSFGQTGTSNLRPFVAQNSVGSPLNGINTLGGGVSPTGGGPGSGVFNPNAFQTGANPFAGSAGPISPGGGDLIMLDKEGNLFWSQSLNTLVNSFGFPLGATSQAQLAQTLLMMQNGNGNAFYQAVQSGRVTPQIYALAGLRWPLPPPGSFVPPGSGGLPQLTQTGLGAGR